MQRAVFGRIFALLATRSFFSEHEDAAVHGREDVKPIWRNERGCLGAHRSVQLSAGSGAGIDRLHQSGIFNGHMNEAARRIEESSVRCSGKRPFTTHVSGERIESYERAGIAS